ncbi:MAG: PD40 domain-containing protein [Saprospiraceae bacterium]|nr:PD40 domain-containing protein [Saprospiraceae bacterium]
MKSKLIFMTLSSFFMMSLTQSDKCTKPVYEIIPQANVLVLAGAKDSPVLSLYRLEEGVPTEIFTFPTLAFQECYTAYSLGMTIQQSPDKNKLLYSTTTDVAYCLVEQKSYPDPGLCNLYIMDISGPKATQKFLAHGFHEQWSPDGKLISFYGIQGNEEGLFICKPDGSDLKKLTGFVGRPYQWSHDSKMICVAGDFIYYIEVATSQVRNTGIETRTHHSHVIWSPDDVFTGFVRGFTTTPEDTTPYFKLLRDVYTTPSYALNTVYRNITNTPDEDEFVFQWSPDGKSIAFHTYTSSPKIEGEVYVVHSDGSKKINLSQDNTALNTLLCWSRDGSRVYFSEHSNGNYKIYSCKPDGTDKKVSKFKSTFLYSPDGKYVAYSGDNDIYIALSDESEVKGIPIYVEHGKPGYLPKVIGWTK